MMQSTITSIAEELLLTSKVVSRLLPAPINESCCTVHKVTCLRVQQYLLIEGWRTICLIG